LTVKGLIEILQTKDPDMPVAGRAGSDWCEADAVEELELVDRGGWISEPYPLPPAQHTFRSAAHESDHYRMVQMHHDDEARKRPYLVIS
jgi:hypothetical protein